MSPSVRTGPAQDPGQVYPCGMGRGEVRAGPATRHFPGLLHSTPETSHPHFHRTTKAKFQHQKNNQSANPKHPGMIGLRLKAQSDRIPLHL